MSKAIYKKMCSLKKNRETNCILLDYKFAVVTLDGLQYH